MFVDLPPNDAASDAESQSFHLDVSSEDALAAASKYLTAAGQVAPGLQGDLQVKSDHLVIHYGRVRTRIATEDAPGGCNVTIERDGAPPLEGTRTWVFVSGIIGFVMAWALAWYNSGGGGLSAFVTISLFFLGMTALVSVLYLVDRSLEQRGVSLCRSLEDGMRGDPNTIVRREIDALERTSSMANGVLFYCASLIIEFFAFIIVWSDGVRDGINEAVTLDVMKAGFAMPIAPAILFGFAWFWYVNRVHRERLNTLN
jgi:hypothetical protein